MAASRSAGGYLYTAVHSWPWYAVRQLYYFYGSLCTLQPKFHAHPELLLYRWSQPAPSCTRGVHFNPMRYQIETIWEFVLGSAIAYYCPSSHTDTLRRGGSLCDPNVGLALYQPHLSYPARPEGGGQSGIRTHISRPIALFTRVRHTPAELLPSSLPSVLALGVLCITHTSLLNGRAVRTSGLRANKPYNPARHHLLVSAKTSLSFAAERIGNRTPFILGRWGRCTRPKVQLQFVAFSNSAAVGFTFHLTLQSICFGILQCATAASLTPGMMNLYRGFHRASAFPGAFFQVAFTGLPPDGLLTRLPRPASKSLVTRHSSAAAPRHMVRTRLALL